MLTTAQPLHWQDARAGPACVRGCRTNECEIGSHHRSCKGEVCDSDDGGRLQTEAADLLAEDGVEAFRRPS